MKNQIFILFIILLIGCKNNNQPTQPSTNMPEDELLKSKIVGQWKCGDSYNFTFYPDSTFVDTVSFPVVTPNPPKYEIFYIVKGKYSISKGLLTFPEMQLLYADTSHLLSFNYMEYYVFYPSQLMFKNETLTLNIVEILTPVSGNGKSVNGNWKTENWIVQVERRPDRMAFWGKIIKDFNFDTVSLKYTMNVSNTFSSPYQVQNDSGSLSYSSNRLSFGTYTTIPKLVDGVLLLDYISWPQFVYEKVK